MVNRSRLTPSSRSYKVSRRTIDLLDRLRLELDLPRGKLVDIAIRLHREEGEEEPKRAGELAEHPTRLRLSSEAVAALELAAGSKAGLIEAAVTSLAGYLASHSELPLRVLTVSGRSRVDKLSPRVNP